MTAEKSHFWVDKQNAPYIQTKPFHKSQKIVEEYPDGSKTFEINVIINQELQREFLGFADTIKILSPPSLTDFMRWKFKLAKESYDFTGDD